MNFCKRKVFLLSFILLILFSLSPNLSFAASGASSTNETAKYAEALKDTSIFVNAQTIVGHLLAGTQVSADSIQNGKVYFQWDGSLAYVNSADVKTITSGSFAPTDGVSSQTADRITTHAITQVFSDTSLKNPILSLEANVGYPVTGIEGAYYKITIGHHSGIVKASSVELMKSGSKNGNSTTVKAAAAKPGIQAPAGSGQKAANNSVAAETFTAKDRYFKVSDKQGAPIYDNSGKTLKLVGYLDSGQVYPRTSDYGNWHQIKFGNAYGYIWKNGTVPASGNTIKDLNTGLHNSGHSFIPKGSISVFDNTSGSLVPFATLPAGIPYPYISDCGNWYKIDVSGRIGYVYKPAVSRAFEASDHYFKVTADNLGIYDNSSGTMVQTGSLTKGQVYARLGDNGSYQKINFGNKIRYVLKSATVVADNSTIKNADKSPPKQYNIFFKPNGDTSVFDNTSGSLVPFGVIKKDVLYPAISVSGNWAKVDVCGRIGYVYTGAVKIVVGALAGKVIVLDPGHGGYDPGAKGKLYQEKTLNLDTALVVADSLRKEGATVIMTRSTDTFLTLQQRVDISTKNHADAFISIHHNSLPTDPGANGLETYYYSSPKDTTLAQYVHDGLVKKINLKDRGIKFGDYHVTRENPQPAILLELGFMSNPSEEKNIATKSFYNQAASGITTGLINYFQAIR